MTVVEAGTLGVHLDASRGGACVLTGVDEDGLAHRQSRGALHAGLELRGVNGEAEHGEDALSAMRHVRARRPLTMRFVNPCGRAAPRPDGALRVTVCAEGSLGVTVAEREGRAVLRLSLIHI